MLEGSPHSGESVNENQVPEEHGVMARIEYDVNKNMALRSGLRDYRGEDKWDKISDSAEELSMLYSARAVEGNMDRAREELQRTETEKGTPRSSSIAENPAHWRQVIAYLEGIQREGSGHVMEEEKWMGDESLRKPIMPPPIIGAPDNVPLDAEHEFAHPANADSGEERLPAGEILPEEGEDIPPIPLFPRIRRIAPAPPPHRSKEEETTGHEAGGDAQLDTEQGRRWLHGFLNPGKEMPDDFVTPKELREPAEMFLQRRDELLHAHAVDAEGLSGWQKMKYRLRDAIGIRVPDNYDFNDDNGLMMGRFNYTSAYKNLQAAIVRDRKARLEREIMNDDPEDKAKKVNEEILIYASRSLVQGIVSNDLAFERERIERMFGQKERGALGKLLDSYTSIPRKYRLGISALLSGAVGVGVGVASGAGLAIVLGYGGVRFARSLTAGASAGVVQEGLSRFFHMRREQKQGKTSIKHQILTSQGVEGLPLEDEGNFETLLDIVRLNAKEYQKELEEMGREEKKKRVISGLAIGIGAGLAAGIAFRPSASAAVGSVQPGGTMSPEGGSIAFQDKVGSPQTPAVKPNSFPPRVGAGINEHMTLSGRRGAFPPWTRVGVDPSSPLETPTGKPQAVTLKETGGSDSVTVRKGEGLWHPVKRQLAEHVRANPQKYHFKPEDLQDAKKVDAFLNRRTQKILMDAGKTEMGVRKPGLHVLLDENDKLQQIDKKELYHRGGEVHEPSAHAKAHRGASVDTAHARRPHTGAGADNTPAGRDARKMTDLMRQSEHSQEVLRQATVDAEIAGGVADVERAATIALEVHQTARRAAENYLEKLGFSPRERTAWLANRHDVTVGKVLKEIPADYDIAKDGGASVDLPYQGVRQFGAVPRQIELARLMREAMKKSAIRLDQFGNPPLAIRDMPIQKFLENIDPVTRKLNPITP
ncbi:MAG: hypothetical protein Q8Q94_03820 [bacterium]|nr:hypothetical protein [bacterium]